MHIDFFLFFYDFEIFVNERNIANFGHVFVTRFHVILESFSRDEINSLTVVVLSFFFGKNVKNSVKIETSSEESTNSCNPKKKNFICLFIGQCFYQFVNNFSLMLLFKINVLEIFGIFGMVVFFRFYSEWEVIKMLTESYLWLGKFNNNRIL